MKPCIIDTSGKIHYCLEKENYSHDYLAQRLIGRKDLFAELTLVKQGYIFAGSQFHTPYSGKEPNQAQINTLFDSGIQYITDFFDIYNQWKVY